MTREKFIKKWLGNSDKQYTEQFKDEMRGDLDLVINYANQAKVIFEHERRLSPDSFDQQMHCRKCDKMS